jgi:hypothetical protein
MLYYIVFYCTISRVRSVQAGGDRPGRRLQPTAVGGVSRGAVVVLFNIIILYYIILYYIILYYIILYIEQ